MTLDEIAASDKLTLNVNDVCKVLGCAPHALHMQAMSAPERLGFPVICIGNRVRIPRLPFLAFLRGA